MLRFLPVILLSTVAFGSTVPVTGSGSFSLGNFFDSSANFCISGAGVDMCASNVPIGPAPPTFLFGTSNNYGADHYAFSLGNQAEYVITMDASGNTLSTQSISGDIQITSYQEFGTRFINGNLNDDWTARGTFVIGVPEPATWILLAIGILALLLWGKSRGKI